MKRPEDWALRFLAQSRLAHLATSTRRGIPHVIPICFAFDGKTIYSSIDEKPKRAAPRYLRRVRNITENPKVSLVVDSYFENWTKLRYVIVNGFAKVIQKGHEHRRAVSLLRKKYPQYNSMRIDHHPIVIIRPVKLIAWSYTPTEHQKIDK